MRLYEPEWEAANRYLRDRQIASVFQPVRAATGGANLGEEYAAIAMPLGPPNSLSKMIVRNHGPSDANTRLLRLGGGRQALLTAFRRYYARDKIDLPNLESGSNFCLWNMDVTSEGGVRRISLEVGVATYGQVMRSCDAMIDEFALFAYLSWPAGRLPRRFSGRTMLQCLPLRKRAHKRAGGPGELFLHPHDRAAGIGVAIATVRAEDEQLLVGVEERPATVGTYPSCIHVVPAGMCNTHGLDHYEAVPEWFLLTTMRGRFLLEWSRLAAFQSGSWHYEQWHAHVDRAWNDRDLVDIELTGLAYDLLNLRPEICAIAMAGDWGCRVDREYRSAGIEPRGVSTIGDIKAGNVVQSGAAALTLTDNWIRTRVGPPHA